MKNVKKTNQTTHHPKCTVKIIYKRPFILKIFKRLTEVTTTNIFLYILDLLNSHFKIVETETAFTPYIIYIEFKNKK